MKARYPTVLLATLLFVPSKGGQAVHVGSRGSPVEPRPGAVALTAAPPQTVELTLPFSGIWGVLQGMDSDETHVGYAAYALDFVPAERLEGAKPVALRHLEDFPCFGRDVLAAAEGVVVWSHDGAPDRPPRAHAKREPGNFIIIRHAPSEFTEYRHLQRRSVQVAVGASVKRGQVIGRCGNSGNAGTPHLHIGLLGSVEPIATRPMRFSRYQVLGPNESWAPGDGTPQAKQLLRSLAATSPR